MLRSIVANTSARSIRGDRLDDTNEALQCGRFVSFLSVEYAHRMSPRQFLDRQRRHGELRSEPVEHTPKVQIKNIGGSCQAQSQHWRARLKCYAWWRKASRPEAFE